MNYKRSRTSARSWRSWSRSNRRRWRKAGRAIAIRGGTVLTVTRGTIQDGVVVIRDGKIAAVGGPNTAIPSGADIVEAKGRFVSPGIIDAHSHIAAESINEGGTTVSSMTGIEDVLDPTDVAIYRDLAGGLTVANVLHGSANPIGGKNQVIKLRWGKDARGLVFEGAPPGIKFALGENPKDMRQFGQTGPRRYPITRAGTEFVIRDAFSRAKAYQKEWQEYERRKKAGEDVSMPRRDLQLEPLVEILEGKRLVHSHTYRADETLMLMRLAEEMGFKIATFQHVLEGYKVADEMAKHGVGGSTFSDWWAYKVEAEDAIPYNAAIMHRRGVLVSINSDSAEHARRLNTEAAKSMHWGGLSEDEALAFVTINPAKQLKIDARVGSLEAGKDADVVIWNKHPLSTYAIVDRVYIDGQQYYDRLAEERRLTDAGKEKTTLTAAEGRSAPSTGPQNAADTTDVIQARGNVWVGSASVPDAGSPASGPITAITNARIFPISGPVDRARHDRHSRQPHRGGWRDGRGSRRRAGDRRQGRRGLSGIHRRADVDRTERAGAARLRRHERDARDQRLREGAGRVSKRQRRDPGRARERHHQRGGRAVGRVDRRPDRGDEPRRLDVGGSHPAAGRRRQLPVPAARSRRRWWRRRRRRRRRCQSQVRGSEEGARCAGEARRGSDCAGARVWAHAGRRTRDRLESRGARADRGSQAADVRRRQ